jgi:pantoate kinase
MYDAGVMSESLEGLICAICADYCRRADVISNKSAPYNVIMEYRYLNYRILNAAIEISGSRDAYEFIMDIGAGNGYAKSALTALSESNYKRKKAEVKQNIAKRLSLF